MPPQAPDVERAILGMIMLERDAIDTASLWLHEDIFYQDIHRTIYRAIIALNNRSQLINIFSVVEQLRETGELDVVGGAYYVTKLTNEVTTAAALEQFCMKLTERFMARELIRVGAQMHYDGFHQQADIFEMVDKAEAMVMAITARLTVETHTMDDALMSTIKLIEKNRASKKLITGVPSGFMALDIVTRGFQEEDLIIIGARPSVGKTAFALNLARNAAKAGKPGAFFSLEMSKERLTLRNLSAEAQMDIYRLQTGQLDDEQMKALHADGISPLSKLPIYIDDSSQLNLWKLRSKLRRLKKKNGIMWAIIDYLQLMDGPEENRERQIAMISRGLKNLAKELKISIIALSQLSREIEKRTKSEPQLSDLRESGAIEQDADLVMFLWGPSETDVEKDPSIADERYLKIAKARDGNLTRVTLVFAGKLQTFKEKGGTLVPLQPSQPQKPISNLFDTPLNNGK